MKRRQLSILLCVCLVATMIFSFAYADSEDSADVTVEQNLIDFDDETDPSISTNDENQFNDSEGQNYLDVDGTNGDSTDQTLIELTEYAISEQEDPEDENIESETQPLSYELTEGHSGMVVLNLGNGNGVYNFADYTAEKKAGTDLRYTTESLAGYADDNGNVTINLPSDSDLNKSFFVVEAVGEENSDGYLPAVSVKLGEEQAYDYRLIGWVNIATGEYYDVSGGSTTAKIDLSNENVFYADWIAASYDHGSNSDANLVKTVSTKDFVTIHMFDYNELFNLYSESLEQNVVIDETTGKVTSISETWTDSGTLYESLLLGNSTDTLKKLTNSFIFVNDGTTPKSGSPSDKTTDDMLSWPNNKSNGNTYTGKGKNPTNAITEWEISNPKSSPLDMLFDTKEGSLGVHYIGEADYLFSIDDKGYYTYNSKDDAAVYNQTEGRFYVYDNPQSVTGTSYTCFLPYNNYGSDLSATNGSVNYWFGMDLSVDFYLSNATGRNGNKVNGNDMVFNFSGDDDILIFIDDSLVLDMSGMHDEAFGSINFTTGEVTVGMSTDSDGNILNGTTTDLNLSAGSHTLQVYYMERGGYASNLEIQFNLVPLWEYETGEVQTITAEKVWKDAAGKTITDGNTLKQLLGEDPFIEVGLFDTIHKATDKNDEHAYTVVTDDAEGITTYTYEYTDENLTENVFVYTEKSEGDSIEDRFVSYVHTATGEDPEKAVGFDSQGRLVDESGYVIVWPEYLNGELVFHLRMDEQTLNAENNWYYAWEMLDPTGDYIALELNEYNRFTTTVGSEEMENYMYWSIIGEEDLESHMNEENFKVILTEAAQEASESLGNTKEAYGLVIVGTSNGTVETKQVRFSQVATLATIEQTDGTSTYCGTYGVTSQSEIDKLGPGAVWYLEDAGESDMHSSSGVIEEFCLYCKLDEGNYYLALDDASQNLITSKDNKATFYYDAMGELMIQLPGGEAIRVEILGDGTISLGEAEMTAAVDDVRIYTYTSTPSSGYAYTITNEIHVSGLTIAKEVSGVSDEQTYNFQITLSYDENSIHPYTGGAIVTYTPDTETENKPETITFEDGVAVLSLQAGETATIMVPYGIYYMTVVETTHGADTTTVYEDGEFQTRVKKTDENYENTDAFASGSVTQDRNTEVVFVNSYRQYFPIDEEIVTDEDDIFNTEAWVKSESVNEYNAIEIEMTTTLPLVTAYDIANGEFTMNFHEVLDSQLVLDEAETDFSVYIGGNKISEEYYDITLASETRPLRSWLLSLFSSGSEINDGCTFHVDVDLTALYKDEVITEEDLQGETDITIFFFADLEGTGLNGTYKSTVWYDVYDGDDWLYTSEEDVVYVYTYEIDIVKYDDSVLTGVDYDRAGLGGAVLGVYYDENCNDPVIRNGEAYTVTSEENGSAIFYGLAEGTYFVKEIKAPSGYVLSNEVLEVELGESLTGYAYSGVYANVPITPGPEDPEEPEEPEEPETPDEPETPETPEVPDEPETPEIPDEPGEPETPEVPDESETTEEPLIPETPDEPETPEEPDEPEMPGVSEGTEEPVAPEIPDEQVTPDTSDETESSDSGPGLPQTGARWNLLVCIVMLAIGGVMLVIAGRGMMATERKRRK